jgi:methyl-accepting chemotaxis protein
MNPTASTHPLPRTSACSDDLIAIAAKGDLIMLLTLLGSALAAVAIGQHDGTLTTALLGGGAILGVGLAMFAAARGKPAAWVTLTACNVAMVALHISTVAQGCASSPRRLTCRPPLA